MELVEQLKHVYSYNEIYELLYDGPVSFDDINDYKNNTKIITNYDFEEGESL